MKKGWRIAAVFFLLVFPACSRPQLSKAPDFTLYGLDPAQKLTLSEVNKDSPVLLAFWATWCPYCRAEIPALNRIHAEYAARGLKLLSINVQEERDTVGAFAAEQGIAYPILMDSTGDVADRYKIEGLPVCVVLAKGGEILYYGFSLPENLDSVLASSHS